MSTKKCPNCGAQIAAASHVCEYCGTSTESATTIDAAWTSISHTLPKRSKADKSRSEYVLTCSCIANTRSQLEKGDTGYYSEICSAYYDFGEEKWFNESIPDSDIEVEVTHWMPLPPADSPHWRSIEETGTPTIKAPGQNDYSIYVIVSLADLDYEQSLTSAQYSGKNDWWISIGAFTLMEDLQVERWMLTPPPPSLKASAAPVSKGGIFSRLFGKK